MSGTRQACGRPLLLLAGLTLAGLTLGGCTGPFAAGDTALYAALDDADVALAAAALQESLETRPNDAAVAWHNPASGHAGAVVPRLTSVSDTGAFCRRYDERVELVDGRTATLANTACRDADGRWVWLTEG